MSYRIPISMHNRLMRGEKPIAYAVIDTHMGKRVYAEKEMTVTRVPLLKPRLSMRYFFASAKISTKDT